MKKISGVKNRLLLVLYLSLIIFFFMGIRLCWLQLVRGTWYQEQALANRIREIAVEPQRGNIYDRCGRELAISIQADAVYAIPAEVKKSGEAKTIARKLATILVIDEEELYQKITKNQQSVWIKFKVEPEQADKIRLLRLPGIGVIPKPQRFYPKNNLAAHVLGIAGDYNQGLEGIEKYYDKILSGLEGRLLVECDAAGREIPDSVHKYISPEEGLSLVLTIDQTLQYIAERELEKIMQQWKPKSSSIIIMDSQSGEILALANRPDFDPNNYQDYPADNRRNFAVCNSYEPGSTFKIAVLSAAVEEKIVSDNERFYCPGFIKVADRVIRCWETTGHGSQTLAEVVQNSCNPGFITMGLRLGVDKFFKYLEAFGFGKKTGIDLPGEAGGIIMSKEATTQVDLASMSIGQANAITPFQLLAAVSAVANGGKLMQPYLVKELRSNKGKVVKSYSPEVVRQVISSDTARKVTELLEGVVTNGSGRNAYVEGYAVAGKTGTAQKALPGGGYSSTDYVASFIGFGPVDDPKLTILVVVDTPQGYPYYGGTVAAPAFREVMKDSLRYLGIPRRYQDEEQPQDTFIYVPSVVNLPVAEAKKILTESGLQGVGIGEGSLVKGQVPPNGAQVTQGSKVLLQLEETKSNQQETVAVPDLEGKSMREVAELLGFLNLILVPEGEPLPTGVAVSQEPSAGTQIKTGSGVRVKFAPPVSLEVGP